ncbi:MAG TPA: 50S ribosomal protein L10, partial [Mesotoga sp.]|nr:50S ribosomal protein L10 [Mesotoga sp.]
MLTRARKEEIVQDLTDRYQRASLILFAEYKGMKVDAITQFRDKLY